MSPSNSTEPHQPDSAQQPQIPESRSPIYETLDSTADTKTARVQENPKEEEQHPEEPMKDGDGDAEEEEEEEGECGFCLFMKGGGCKETFVEWEKCIEEAEKKEEDVVQKCFQVTTALKKCMEANSDYYAPILQAEKSLEEETVKQLGEEEKLSGGEEGSFLGGNDSKKQS